VQPSAVTSTRNHVSPECFGNDDSPFVSRRATPPPCDAPVCPLDNGGLIGVRPGASRYLLHRSDSRRRKRTTFRFKMLNNILHHLAQITVDLEGIIAVDSRNEVWAFSKVGLILVAPFHPLVVLIARFHLRTSSTAR